jgi:cathepsin B
MRNAKNPWGFRTTADIDVTNITQIEGKLGLLEVDETYEPNDDGSQNPNSSRRLESISLPQLNPIIAHLPTKFCPFKEFCPDHCPCLPHSLDLRTKYPECPSIAKIRNQGGCGSCWAFATMNSLSDRYCIHYSYIQPPQPQLGVHERWFSVQDPLECGTPSQGIFGCSGASVIDAGFRFAKSNGVCTGEDPADHYLCKPYKGSTAGGCFNKCTFPVSYYFYPFDKFKIASYNLIQGDNLDHTNHKMKCALHQRGSIAIGIRIYQDFFFYSGPGVYIHTFGWFCGLHAMRAIGYGTYNGIPYWLIANSWGTGWGDQGFVKIYRGANHVDVETYAAEGNF